MLLRPLLIAAVLVAVCPGVEQANAKRISISAFVDQWDTDHDGTLDIHEFTKAAMSHFDALDRDHNGSLKRSQLRGIISYIEFRKADTDKNNLLDRQEYRILMEKLFHAADKDHDGTLDKKELRRLVGMSRFHFFEAP